MLHVDFSQWRLPPAWAKPDAVSAAVAVVGAILVLIEYLNQRRKWRLERAAELERRFDEDPVLRFAVLCLDWGAGDLPVPAEYVAFVGFPFVAHNKALLYEALRPSLTKRIRTDRVGTFYRQAFVALFNHLERTAGAWRRGHVVKKDLPQTQWVVRQLLRWSHTGDEPPQNWFLPALDRWYRKVEGDKSLGDLLLVFAGLKRQPRIPRRRRTAARDAAALGASGQRQGDPPNLLQEETTHPDGPVTHP